MASEPAIDPREDAPLAAEAPSPQLTLVRGERPVSDLRGAPYLPFAVGTGLAVWAGLIYVFLGLLTNAFG